MPSPQSGLVFRLSEAALILSKNSGRLVTEEMLREAVADGLPVDADDRVDLRELCAWLNREMSHGA